MNAASPLSQPDEHHAIRHVAALLRIAHHIPGRVRLKLAGDSQSGLAQAIDEARRFVKSVATTAGIRSVDLNPLARSCVVEYDPEVIPPAAWQDMVDGVRSPAAETLLRTLARASG